MDRLHTTFRNTARRRYRVATIATILLCNMILAPVAFSDSVPLEDMEVVGSDFGFFLCRGAGCSMVRPIVSTLNHLYEGIDTIESEDFRSEVCDDIRRERPNGCGSGGYRTGDPLSGIPAAPGYDRHWRPNGCGTGPFANAFLDAILDRGYHDFFRLNEPYQGVSFLPACNGHDECFATAGADFGTCNNSFFETMYAACGSILNCRKFALAYGAAVNTNFGRNAFDNSQADTNCAVWADQYKLNQCDDN